MINLRKGLTMIELLVVVGAIGLLAGITIQVIDIGRQKDVANEASVRSNLEKTVATIEAYFQGENETYPDDGSNDNPLDSSASDKDVAAVYLKTWPSDFVYETNGTKTRFAVHVVKPTDPSAYFKYYSVWKEIRECTDVSSMSSCT